MTHLGNQNFLPSLIVTQRVTKQFDKSGFDKLVQLLELSLAQFNNPANSV